MGLSDREQLEMLFERHYAAVLAFALRRGPRSLAQDVASETFVIAWRRREEVPADALPWLYGVARRVLANERRVALRRLPGREREALMLVAWEDLSPAQAAIAAGCTQ